MTRKEKLKQALAAIVDAMVPEDRSTPPAAPSPPPMDHEPYIKMDGSLCCQRHDNEFMWRAERTRCMVMPLHEWIKATEVARTRESNPFNMPSVGPALDALRQVLRDLGYIEGQNLLLEHRYADWQPDRLPALAAELVRLHPDVIYTWSTPGVLAAQRATAGTGEHDLTAAQDKRIGRAQSGLQRLALGCSQCTDKDRWSHTA